MNAQETAIELARVGQELEDHKRDHSGHPGYGTLSEKMTTMEQSLLQIKFTAYGIALMAVLLLTGLDLGKLLKLLGL